ncbi:kinase-like protein [Hypomontagnella monticulosa]|nr:kinase-like protein [Hypomontagnella monticulosa]
MDSEDHISGEEYPSNSKTDGGDIQSISVSSGTRSISISEAQDTSDTGDRMDEHRNMMLASLLEDYIRTRAAEYMSSAHGKNYTRQSPEIQSLARQLYTEASRALASNGVLSNSMTSDNLRGTRRQYLSALDNLVASTQAPAANVRGPMGDLVSQISRLAIVPHPINEMGLVLPSPLPDLPRSHYQSSFQEIALLGKGGFGKVYRCFNPLDHGTYAIKKIQISPKLGRRFRDGKLEELQHILGEVQALATLDHPNIVRYHATWFEEPHQPPPNVDDRDTSTGTRLQHRQQFLLESHSFSEDAGGAPGPSLSGGIIFAEDSNDPNMQLVGPQWTEEASSDAAAEIPSESSSSNVFTDGRGPGNSSQRQENFDATGHTLYIQMSLYPMTLAQYINRQPSGNDSLKHCFHLLPSLRLIRAIHTGLRYIHSKGLLHRDIKPGNIFLSSSDTGPEPQGGYCDLACPSCQRRPESRQPRWLNPRIGDFGLVGQLAHGELPLSPFKDDGSLRSPEKPVGTAYYRPPISKGAIDEKVDIFALGVVFVELLCPCGTSMQRVDMLQQLQAGYAPWDIENNLTNEGQTSEVIKDVVTLVKGMINPDPVTRWSSAQVDDAIEGILHRCSPRTSIPITPRSNP